MITELATNLNPAGIRTATVERVAEALRDRIVKGEIAPGTRLVERHLSADLGVSRTPIREALKLLQADGLVEISLHRGAQVTTYTPEEALHLFDIIAVIEALAAECVAERREAKVLDGLEALHGEMIGRYAARDLSAYFDANSAIHAAIVAGAGNPILSASHGKIMRRAERGRFLAIMDADRWAEAVGEHERAMAAFRNSDAALASSIWRRHLTRSGETVATVLRNRT